MDARVVTPEQAGLFAAWRVAALVRMPYMAPYLFGVRVLDAPGLGTFAVDEGMRLYIDFDAVAGWGADACSQVLLHEVGHLFADHAQQRRDYAVPEDHARLFNAASDASLNDDLVQAGLDHIAAIGILPATLGQPDFQTPYTYYQALLARMPPQGEAEQDLGAGGEHGQDDGDPQEPYSGCGSGSGGPRAPCELDAEDDLGGAAPAATAAETRRVRLSTAAEILAHDARSRGSVPAGLLEQASAHLAPTTTPWQRLLASSLRRALRTRPGHDRTCVTRRDRRRRDIPIGDGVAVLPGRIGIRPRIAAVRDTSGSMSIQDLTAASNEILGIARALRVRGSDLRLYDVDADVAATSTFTTPGALLRVAGRGGTDMRVGIAAALAHQPRPDVVVVLTDGETPWPDEPVGVPVLACIVPADPEQGARALAAVPGFITTVLAQDPGPGDR